MDAHQRSSAESIVMADKRKKKPNRCVINGIPHVLIVLEVNTAFPNGSPRQCTRIPEEASVRVDTPEPKRFITAYIPQVNMRDG